MFSYVVEEEEEEKRGRLAAANGLRSAVAAGRARRLRSTMAARQE
jgi:hypothetical protein